MATITLPATIVPNKVTPFLRSFGGVLTPISGGEEQLINRFGMRLAGRFIIPSKRYRTEGRVLVSRLMQAKASLLLLPWPQPGFDPGSEGAPRVRVVVSGGVTLQLKGLPAGKQLVEGQYLSVVKDRRYLHALTADATANGSGDITVSVWPPMRVAFAINDVVEITQPKIEGLVQPGEELSWDISIDKFLDVGFTIAEGK